MFHGEYPKVMRELIDKRSKEEGREKSRLPEFSPEWAANVKGSIDFVGLNFYNAEICKAEIKEGDHPSWKMFMKVPFFSANNPGWNQDSNVYRCHDIRWPKCGADWQDFAPSGIRGCIKWVSDTYENPIIMVTETGCSGADDRLDDTQRKEFFKLSINAVLKSIKEDGKNVIGYIGWSLLDVYEWRSGYT